MAPTKAHRYAYPSPATGVCMDRNQYRAIVLTILLLGSSVAYAVSLL
ncbi:MULTISPECIES: hypothetical protein [Halobacterium]|uniref:Uncharacterized protein n=1 Tax=Halobacterium salinarum TaxID=2242 RepID=A0A841HAU9_HALSI|nr:MULTISPECIES: hypothetical protein [Halobacterium]MBB6089518.1 hypothetical protein [Halobacterium salinarum]MCF2164268.1 hypothetical protein [Halobacterium salinarum]MCF2167055.1 hypothetical protein [Halobacterium salinarum]MCF2207251.1 hypothetical protein [Halobacterium salinarum]MCF2239109.1 hypothetical protein [Halobacterium salinarum]